MKFKYKKLMSQYFRLHPKLQYILTWLDVWCLNRIGKEILVTSLIRNNGIHGAKRAADIRTEYGYFSCYEVSIICEHLNRLFPYGDEIHSTALYHKVGNGALHFHIQCKDNMEQTPGWIEGK
jgi:hypothetical protein